MNRDTEEAEMERVERAELYLSHLLRLGVMLSAAIVVVGLVLLFTTQNYTGYMHDGLHSLIGYPPQAGSAPIETSVSDIVNGLAHADPSAVIALGLVVLIMTPIMRVAASVLLFLFQHDYVYVFLTLFVLIVLLLSFALGKVE